MSGASKHIDPSICLSMRISNAERVPVPSKHQNAILHPSHVIPALLDARRGIDDALGTPVSPHMPMNDWSEKVSSHTISLNDHWINSDKAQKTCRFECPLSKAFRFWDGGTFSEKGLYVISRIW
jgi:hypothetical protein